MAYRSRYARRYSRRSKHNFLATLIIIIVLLWVTFTWILPPFIDILGKITGIFKTSPKVESSVLENPTLAPPVLNIPYEATNSASVDIKGFATARSKVKIYLDEELIQTADTTENGNFNAKGISLSLGTNSIYGRTEGENSQESLPSKTIQLIFDNEKPSLEISEPSDGQTFKGERKIKVSGKTEPGAVLSISGERVILGAEGKFNHEVSLSDGENTITIKVHDLAGNITEVARKVTFQP